MKISFVIPFHNEEGNCCKMLNRVISYAQRAKIAFEIIPINDKSSDKTPQILNQYSLKYKGIVRPIHRKGDREEKGNTMGKALIEGTRMAKGDIVIWTMGDLADDAKTYQRIIEKLNDGYDMVFGSRYMPGGSRGNLDPLKAFLSSWGTILARILFHIPVHDITNAFRGFHKKVFDEIKLTSTGFSISPEFAIKAYFKGFKLGEVPTVYTNRVEGISSFKLFNMTKSYLRLYFNLWIMHISKI